MGYYTEFKIELSGDARQVEEIRLGLSWEAQRQKTLDELPDGYDIKAAKAAVAKIRVGDAECFAASVDAFSEAMKWYTFEADIKAISLQFPKVMFTVEGHGEEQGDQWMAYVKNGKMQMCKAVVTYPPFDERKMV